MNYCKICGRPAGIYEICRDCQEKVDRGEVKKCDSCGSYYIGMECPCRRVKRNQEQQQTTNVTIENTSPEEESAFSKGVGGSFGAGCGCILFILAMVAIVGIVFAIAYATQQ